MFDFLKKVPLFANLPDDDLDLLCAVVIEEHYPAEVIVFAEGDVGDKAYVIMTGEVEILKESGGQTISLATRKSGEVIGEMSLLDQTPRFASDRRTASTCMVAGRPSALTGTLWKSSGRPPAPKKPTMVQSTFGLMMCWWILLAMSITSPAC